MALSWSFGAALFVFHLLFAHSVKERDNDICNKPVVYGPCMAYNERWYFSPKDNDCIKFIYGGCQGNRNNFYSKTACEKRCKNMNESDDGSVSKSIAMDNDNSHREGPCTTLLKRKMAFANIMVFGAPIGPGNYTPSCDENGYFQQMQCYVDQSECWCVDRWGMELRHRKGMLTRGPADSLQCG